MANWITLTADHLKASGHGSIVDSAQTLAVGNIDPITEAIADAVARVRRAVITGNVPDADATKVPNSLRALTIRLALYSLMERIGLALSEDQRDSRRNDNSDLNRIADNRVKVEVADTPPASGSGEMQPTGHKVDAVNIPHRQTGRHLTGGL